VCDVKNYVTECNDEIVFLGATVTRSV